MDGMGSGWIKLERAGLWSMETFVWITIFFSFAKKTDISV